MNWPALALLGLAAAAAAAAWSTCRRVRRDHALLALLQVFGPARAAALRDPRLLLVWQPLAVSARRLFPEAFERLDGTVPGAFPFSRAEIEQGHAAWTADWLAWEAAHDEESRLKIEGAEQELRRAPDAAAHALARARLDRLQHEKMERYQARYAEYVRTARALQGLVD